MEGGLSLAEVAEIVPEFRRAARSWRVSVRKAVI